MNQRINPESPLLLFALLAGSSLTVMSGAAVSPAMPAITAAFADEPMADFLTRLVLTMPALFIALCAPLGGLLVDRVGRKPVIVISLTLYGLSGTVGLYTDSLTMLLASRALLGVAVGGLMTACTTLIGDCYQGVRRSQVLGLQASSAAIGGVVFLLGGGLLTELSWRGPFTLYLAAFVLLPITLIALRQAPVYTPAQRAEAAARGDQQRPAMASLIGLYACMLLGMGLFYVVPLQLPYRLHELGYMSGALAGAALSVNTVCAAILSFSYRQLYLRFPEWQLLAASFFAIAGGLGLIGAAEGLPLILTGLSFVGAALGLLIPTVNQWLLRIAPLSMRGRIISGSTAGLFLGQFLSPFLSQPLVGLTGLAGAFLAFSALALVVAVLVTVLARRGRPHDPRTDATRGAS